MVKNINTSTLGTWSATGVTRLETVAVAIAFGVIATVFAVTGMTAKSMMSNDMSENGTSVGKPSISAYGSLVPMVRTNHVTDLNDAEATISILAMNNVQR